jgi:hypothetical protein
MQRDGYQGDALCLTGEGECVLSHSYLLSPHLPPAILAGHFPQSHLYKLHHRQAATHDIGMPKL